MFSTAIMERTVAIAAMTLLLSTVSIGQSTLTARSLIHSADSLANTIKVDQQLARVSTTNIDTTGRAATWTYVYFWFDTSSAHADQEYFFVGQGGSVAFDHAQPLGYGPMVLTNSWVDSDSALRVSQESWGSKIKHQYPTCPVSASLWQLPAPPFTTEWQVDYRCPDSTRSVFINATTGAVLKTASIVTSVGNATGARLPSMPELSQNYPNPFNPSTTIRYALPQRSHVTLTVFNTLGQHVATLVDAVEDAGFHNVRFDGSGVASGVYLYRLRAGGYVEVKKLVLVR